MVFIRSSRLNFLVFAIFLLSSVAMSEVTTEDSNRYFQFLMRLNSSSPLEHAGSHGTLGLGLGMGMGVYYASVDPEILRQHWRKSNQLADGDNGIQQRFVVPRMYLHKGFPLSIDAGFGLGQDVSTKAKVMSGYVQWTPVEGFAMPALAVRTGFSRFMGLATTDASSVSVDGVLSYGFLRLLTVYGSVGLARHQIEVRSGEEFGTSLSLAENGAPSIQSTRIARTKSLGLQFQIMPPFLVTTGEMQVSSEGVVSYLAKLSLGM